MPMNIDVRMQSQTWKKINKEEIFFPQNNNKMSFSDQGLSFNDTGYKRRKHVAVIYFLLAH